MPNEAPRSILAAVLWYAALALAINLVRYYGELQQWEPAVFNTDAGGGGSPLSITFLVLPFGFLIGRRLAQNGHRPAATGKALLLQLAGIGLLVGIFVAAMQLVPDWRTKGWVINAGALLCGLFAFVAFRRAYVACLLAGILARLPVMAIQFHAVQNDFDVHFAKGPPDAPKEDALFLLTMAQSVLWPFAFTTLVGGLFAVLGAATVRKRG